MDHRYRARNRIFFTCWWAVSVALTATLGISCALDESLADLPCQQGQCVAGYECHPLRNICAPRVERGCGNAQLCWQRLQTGEACSPEGVFVGCSEAEGCAEGCRTCEDARWSECEYACDLGSLSHCASCNDNCSQRVDNATAACVDAGSGSHCSYTQGKPGFSDVDRNPGNGCEATCVPTNGGIEVCDSQDNDCNGHVDDNISPSDVVSQCVAYYPQAEFVTEWSCPDHCAIVDCSPGQFDADGVISNGCEFSCTVSNGGVETCDSLDNDCDGAIDTADTDLNELSAVNADCVQRYPAAVHVSRWSCFQSCSIAQCKAGFSNSDNLINNGCENPSCALSNNGIETCDGQDNDCDGAIDTADSDLATPGLVNADCSVRYPQAAFVAQWSCSGTCTIAACQTGYANDDNAVQNGCEFTSCTPSNGGVEVCDGDDNDCDGAIDTADTELATPALVDADCSAQHPQAVNVAQWSCTGTCSIASCDSGFFDGDNDSTNGCESSGCTPTATEYCDGVDNNCNNQVDENCQLNWSTKQEITAGLANAEVNHLAVDTNGNLWATSTSWGGRAAYLPENGSAFQAVHGLHNGTVTFVKVDGGGNAWFGYTSCVVRVSASRTNIASHCNIKSALGAAVDPDSGRVFISAGYKLHVFNLDGSKRCRGNLGLPSNSLVFSRTNPANIWLTRGAEVTELIAPQNCQASGSDNIAVGLGLKDGTYDHGGTPGRSQETDDLLWFGSVTSGIFRFHLTDRTTTQWQAAEGLFDNRVTSLAVAQDLRLVFAGGLGALSVYNIRHNQWQLYDSAVMPDQDVTAVAYDRARRTLWIGTANAGVIGVSLR